MTARSYHVGPLAVGTPNDAHPVGALAPMHASQASGIPLPSTSTWSSPPGQRSSASATPSPSASPDPPPLPPAPLLLLAPLPPAPLLLLAPLPPAPLLLLPTAWPKCPTQVPPSASL